MELEDRIELIEKAKAENKKIAMYIVEDELSAQFRYRVYNIMDTLEDDNSWRAVYFLNAEMSEIEKYLEDSDLVIILRQSAKDAGILRVIDLAHQAGKKVLFDLDDLVFDFRYLRLLMSATASKNVFYWSFYIYGVRRIAKKVDGFLVTNDFLGKKIKGSFNKPYKVIFNSLNRKQIRVFDRKKNKLNDKFVIGYFSGSPTHKRDFRVAEPGVIKFLSKHNDAELMVVGFFEISEAMGNKLKENRVRLLESVKYLKMQTMLQEVDVNIAPLVISDFTNCKSELKFFEAAAAETVTIASPTYTFKNAISDGKNGLLAKPGEWYDKLEYLYNNPKERQRIAKDAREYALKHYYGKEFLKEVEEAYSYFVR